MARNIVKWIVAVLIVSALFGQIILHHSYPTIANWVDAIMVVVGMVCFVRIILELII